MAFYGFFFNTKYFLSLDKHDKASLHTLKFVQTRLRFNLRFVQVFKAIAKQLRRNFVFVTVKRVHEKSLTPVHNEPLIGIAEKLIRRAAIVVIAQYQINNITFFNIVYRGFKQ